MTFDEKRARELCNRRPTPMCAPDCEHIECVYVVALEQHDAIWARSGREYLSAALDEIARLRRLCEEACNLAAKSDERMTDEDIARISKIRREIEGAK